MDSDTPTERSLSARAFLLAGAGIHTFTFWVSLGVKATVDAELARVRTVTLVMGLKESHDARTRNMAGWLRS